MQNFAETQAANIATRQRLEALTIADIDAMSPAERIAASRLARSLGGDNMKYLSNMAYADRFGLGYVGGFMVRYAAEGDTGIKTFALDHCEDDPMPDNWNDFGAVLEEVEGKMRDYFASAAVTASDEDIAKIMAWFTNAHAADRKAA